jgi:hypothetical protein
MEGVGLEEGVGFGEGGDRRLREASCSPRSPSQRKRKSLKGGATLSAKGERAAAYPFGSSPGWAVGRNLA